MIGLTGIPDDPGGWDALIWIKEQEESLKRAGVPVYQPLDLSSKG